MHGVPGPLLSQRWCQLADFGPKARFLLSTHLHLFTPSSVPTTNGLLRTQTTGTWLAAKRPTMCPCFRFSCCGERRPLGARFAICNEARNLGRTRNSIAPGRDWTGISGHADWTGLEKLCSDSQSPILLPRMFAKYGAGSVRPLGAFWGTTRGLLSVFGLVPGPSGEVVFSTSLVNELGQASATLFSFPVGPFKGLPQSVGSTRGLRQDARLLAVNGVSRSTAEPARGVPSVAPQRVPRCLKGRDAQPCFNAFQDHFAV